MAKIPQELLDKLAMTEVRVLQEAMDNPETCSPAMLANVRRFLQQNNLVTTPETVGVIPLVRKALPNFEEYEN